MACVGDTVSGTSHSLGRLRFHLQGGHVNQDLAESLKTGDIATFGMKNVAAIMRHSVLSVDLGVLVHSRDMSAGFDCILCCPVCFGLACARTHAAGLLCALGRLNVHPGKQAW